MKRPPILLCVWLAAAAPGVACAAGSLTATLRHAGVASAQARRLAHEARAAGVPAITVDGWAYRFAALHGKGLPVSLAVEQVFEGLMKGVAPGRITIALGAYAHDLMAARRTLDRHAMRGSMLAHPRAVRHALSDIVIARRAGLGGEAIRQLLGEQRLTISRVSAYVQVAADLRGWGITRRDIVRMLGKARRQGVTRRRLLSLDAALARKAARGQGPHDLGSALKEGLGLKGPMGPGIPSGPGGLTGMPGGAMGSGPGGGMTGPGGGMGGEAMGNP